MAIRESTLTLFCILTGSVICAVSMQGANAQPIRSRPYPPDCTVNGSFTAGKVRYLRPNDGFNLLQNGVNLKSPDDDTYQAPQMNQNQSMVAPNSTYAKIIDAAYNLAPDYLQHALCQNVDVVYVDPDHQSPLGWSYWEEQQLGQMDNSSPDASYPAVGSGKGVYIAISTKILDKQPRLKHLEKEGLRGLLTTSYQKIIKDVNITDNSGGVAEKLAAEAVLFVLAREMAFAAEHQLVLYGGLPSLACTGGKSFYNISWNNYTDLQPDLGKIHRLGDQKTGSGVTPIDNNLPSIRRIINDSATYAVNQPAIDAINDLKYVYGASDDSNFKPEWASLLATVAPIEDFVTTYTVVALSRSKAGIDNIKLDFRDGESSKNVIQNITIDKSKLKAKSDCLTGVNGLNNQLALLPLKP